MGQFNPYRRISGAWARPISGKLIQNKAFSRKMILKEFQGWPNRPNSGKLVHIWINSCHTEEHYPLPYGLAVYCQRFEITRIGKLGSKYDPFNAFLAVSNPHIHLEFSKFSTHFRFTADQKFYPKIFFHYQSMPIKILARVPWKTFLNFIFNYINVSFVWF